MSINFCINLAKDTEWEINYFCPECEMMYKHYSTMEDWSGNMYHHIKLNLELNGSIFIKCDDCNTIFEIKKKEEIK